MSKEIIETVKYSCDKCGKKDIVPYNDTEVYLDGTQDYTHTASVNIDLYIAYSGAGEKHVCKKCAKEILEKALKEVVSDRREHN